VRTLSRVNEHTRFIVILQPADCMKGKGKGNDYYAQVGKTIAASLA
jgi:hypothetical protein